MSDDELRNPYGPEEEDITVLTAAWLLVVLAVLGLALWFWGVWKSYT